MSSPSIRTTTRLAVLASAMVLALLGSPTQPAVASVATAASFGTTASFGTARVGSAPAGEGSSVVAYDPITDTIYVGNGFNANGPGVGGNTVSVIDGRRCDAHTVEGCMGPWPTVTVGGSPASIAVDAAHHTVYVANADADSVSLIDARTCHAGNVSGCGQSVVSVPAGALSSVGMYVDKPHHTLYVTNFDDSTVSLIDTAACNAMHTNGCPSSPPPTVTVPYGPGDVDVNGLTHTAYVATFTGLAAFDTNTCNASTQGGCGHVGVFTLCTDCFGPFSAKVDESTNTVYEGDGDASIAAIDGASCDADDLAGCATAPSGKVTLAAPGYEHVLWLMVDEPLHSVYASFQKDDELFVIDTRACNRTHLNRCAALTPPSVHTGSNPQMIALDLRSQTLYVADERDASVAVIDASRCSALDTSGCRRLPPSVRLEHPNGLAVSDRAHTMYVSAGDNTVSMIDIRGCNQLVTAGCKRPPTTVTVGDFPGAIIADEATHTVYVANQGVNGSGSVSVLDTRVCNARRSGCAPTATLPIDGQPVDLAVNSATGTLYVATVDHAGSDVINVVNGSTCNAVATSGCLSAGVMKLQPTADCGGARIALAVDRTTNTIYASHVSCDGTGDQVYVFDGHTCDAVNVTGCGDAAAQVPAGLNPYGLAIDETSHTLYAALLGDGELSGSVAIIDTRTCSALDTHGCGAQPVRTPAGFGSSIAALNPLTHQVVVVNDQDASITVIDGRRCHAGSTSGCRQATAALPVDDYSYAVAVSPRTDTAYVASSVKGSVSVVSLHGRP